MDNIKLYKIESKQALEFHETGFFKLIWLEKGRMNLRLDLKERPIENNGLLMVLPDTEIELDTDSDTEGFAISFAVSIIKIDGRDFAVDVFRLFVGYIDGRKAELEEDLLNKIRNIIHLLFEEYESKKPNFEIAWSFLKIILLHLIRSAGNTIAVPDKNIERFHKFFSLLNQYAKEEKQVKFYADKLNISTKRLNQILQSLTRKSASYFIQEHLIMESKRELIKGDLSVNEIAYSLGFEDRAYFSRFFKRWTGIPPGRFKKMYFQEIDEKLYKEGILNYLTD